MKEFKADIAIIGAGAAGMMASHFAAAKGKSVIILEHNDRVGRKILISGGGRCNFTNIHSGFKDFESKDLDFFKPALSKFTPRDFLKMVRKEEIPYFEKKLGQLFVKTSAREINNLLLRRLHEHKVKILLKETNLQVKKQKEEFVIFNNQTKVMSKKLIIATGGLSIPTIGASDFGHKVAKQFGHKLVHTEPALVPLKIKGFEELAGISLVAQVSCGKHSITEDILFTHKGLSGPAILKISLYWKPGDELVINWLPGKKKDLVTTKKELKKYLPNKFVHFVFEQLSMDSFFSMKLKPNGTEGFRKAEVTRGGVATDKINPKTMESELCSGLYFIGEVLDVTGQLGGHNFQWAWASAYAAGTSIA